MRLNPGERPHVDADAHTQSDGGEVREVGQRHDLGRHGLARARQKGVTSEPPECGEREAAILFWCAPRVAGLRVGQRQSLFVLGQLQRLRVEIPRQFRTQLHLRIVLRSAGATVCH